MSGTEPDKLLNIFAFRLSVNKAFGITYQTDLQYGWLSETDFDLLTFNTVKISDTIVEQKVFRRVFLCV